MTFFLISIILSLLLSRKIHDWVKTRFQIVYWEAFLISFAPVFLILALLPLLGVPLSHPVSGQTIIENEVIWPLLFLAVAFPVVIVGKYLLNNMLGKSK